MPPAGGNVNSPESGTYGERAALDRLQASLPGQNPGSPAATQPMSPPQGRPGPAPTPPGQGGTGGPPAALFAPTIQPDTPVSTPLNVNAAPVVPQDGPAQRLMLWHKLANDPAVADETRELAQRMVVKLSQPARA